jgi:carboxypeptidase Taq
MENSMEPQLDALRTRLLEINDLESAAALLSWDQETYMPPGGGEARARQMATLSRLAHEKFTDPAVGRLLEGLEPYAASLPYDSDDGSLIRVTRRDYDKAIKVPAEFVGRFSSHAAAAYQTWTQARPANDFKRVEPFLERTLEFSREMAGFFPGYEHIADPLIDDRDYGMKASSTRALFAELRAGLVPLVQAITAQPPIDDGFVHRSYPHDAQLAFGEDVIRRLGYDFTRGRQDLTHHPFMTKFSLGDVRITTRVQTNDVRDALFSTIHEAGHAMYEQGINMAYDGTPLASGTSSGVHESQSRLWENIVGRSRPFWQHFYGQIQAAFPDQLGDVDPDRWYRAINKVERSLIRTDADEVTYNLHVILRFDFELDMLEGRLRVADLPEAWRERYKADLGVAPPNDSDGVLQDVHWFVGTIGGMFQGYTLGNVLSAQFFDQATRAHPQIHDEMAAGEFGTLHGWLRDNVYRHGRKLTAPELVERVTGGPLSTAPYLSYLQTKFGELYNLS